VTRLGIITLAVLLAGGCAAYQEREAFSYRFADNQPGPTRQLVSRLPAPQPPESDQNPLGVPIAVGTTDGEERAVVAFDIASGEQLWRQRLEPLTRPEVLGDVVLLSVRGEDGEEVVALDLRSGSELWREETNGMAFVGGDREGDTLVYVVSVGAAGGERREARVSAVDARSGATRWEHEIEGVLGDPALRGGLAFVPWERQNIAILDQETGLEQARLRSTDDVIAWVRATPAGVFYGSKGIYRLTARSASGTKEGSVYREPPVPEPAGDPLVAEDGFMPKPGTRSARGRIRILFEPAPPSGEDGIPVVNDSFYFIYYRFVFAFDGEQNVRWARIVDQEIVGSQVLTTGLLTMGAEGALHLLDASTGNDRWAGNVDAQLASVTLRAEGFAPEGGAGEPRDLRTSLNEVALDPDNRLVPARGYAIGLLAQIEDPEITRDLLDIYAQRSTPGALREVIGTALQGRSAGSEYLVQGLDQHYDFIEDTKVPPLGLIVPSLIEQQQREAVPGLIRHMMDHETPLDLLPLVVRAVVELGDEQVAPALREFLRLYHADTTFRETPDALAVAAEGMYRHGGPEGREMLQQLVADATTLEGLSTNVREMFDAEQRRAEASARAEAEAAAQAAADARRQEVAARPLRLSQEQVNSAFAEHADALRECIVSEIERNPRLAQVRFVFILEGDGTAHDYTFAPNTAEFIQCLQPKLSEVSFPPFRQRRQRATFTISVRPSAPEQQETAAAEPDGPQPWWVKHRGRVAPPNVVASALPWFVRRQAPPPEQQPQPAQPAVAQRPPQQQPAQQEPAQQEPSGAWWQEASPGQAPPQQQPPQQQPRPREPAQQQPQQQQPAQQPQQPQPPLEEETPWWLPAE
jgi:hypothetical protein